MASEVFSARESGVNPLNAISGGSRNEAKITRPRIGNSSKAQVNGINYNISHEMNEGGTGHFRVKDADVSGHYMDFWYGRGHANTQSSTWKKATAWMKSPQRQREHNKKK